MKLHVRAAALSTWRKVYSRN